MNVDPVQPTSPEPSQRNCRRCGRLRALTVLLFLAVLVYLAFRFTRDVPVTYADAVEHMKYGSTGGERGSGVPVSLWKTLPELFREYLPGDGLPAIGFIYEPGKDLPVGTSRRNVM